MSLLALCEWLGATPLSIALHESRYAFLAVLALHVLTIALFAGAALVLDLRLLGLTLVRVRVSELLDAWLPWALTGFVIMVLSGVLLFYAAPAERYENTFFRLKMGLLALAGLNVWFFHRYTCRDIGAWDRAPRPPVRVRIAGGIALLLWASIIVAGRMIPYQQYWFD